MLVDGEAGLENEKQVASGQKRALESWNSDFHFRARWRGGQLNN